MKEGKRIRKFKNNCIVLLLSLIIIKVLKKVNRVFKAHIHFGQTGEDTILRELLGRNKKEIFYIDVGCNHPISLSNTFNFYIEGGRGICIDANEELVNTYKKVRKKDIVLNSLISNNENETTFYNLDNHVRSSASPEYLSTIQDSQEINSCTKKVMTPRSLNSILEEYISKDQMIDLLSIDVEGMDYEVLASIDLSKYRPRVIIVEIHDLDISGIESSENKIIKYLSKYHYKLKFYATMNAYFIPIS